MNAENRIRLLLGAQAALLGMITPNIRGVACSLEDGVITVTSVFDGVISSDDIERCEIVTTEIVANFLTETIETKAVSHNAQLPLSLLDVGEWVYRRYEGE